MIFDGHTVETGKGSKVVLLFSSGTITTLKEDSVLNIKKFAQQKFDPKSAGKLSARKDEPSPSETIIDLSLGDMVVDVKKLKKESSFNIDSPVGTAGIRGTIPRIKVAKLPGGGFNQTTQMLKGKISYLPKGGGLAHLARPRTKPCCRHHGCGQKSPHADRSCANLYHESHSGRGRPGECGHW